MTSAPSRERSAVAMEPLDAATRAFLTRGAPRDPLAVLPRGVAVTLWSADGLGPALTGARALLARARPQMVQLHAGPQGLTSGVARAADAVRALVPGVVLIVGVAWDGWIAEYETAAAPRRAEIERLYLGAVESAWRAGAVLAVINSENAGKVYPRAARMLGARLIDAIRARCPGLLIALTSYDHPHYHPEERDHGGRLDADDEGFPWSVYLGAREVVSRVEGLVVPATGRVDLSMEQVYAAPPKADDGTQPVASVGALLARLASSRESFARAERLGWIDPVVPHVPYVQAHHVPAVSSAGLGAQLPRVAFWAAPTRRDADGELAIEVLAEAARGPLALPTEGPRLAVVRAWAQGRLSLKTDGVWGQLSRAAARTFQTARGLEARGELDAATLAALAAA